MSWNQNFSKFWSKLIALHSNDPIETGCTVWFHLYLNWSHFYMIKNNEFDNWILGNRVNWLRINRHTYKLTLKPLLFDCATLALVYFHYYANRNFSLKVIHWNQIILVSSQGKDLIFWEFGVISTEITEPYGMIGIKNKLLIYIWCTLNIWYMDIRNSKLRSMFQADFKGEIHIENSIVSI